jgi:hypothetical protein
MEIQNFSQKNTKSRGHLEDMAIDGRILLIQILKEQVAMKRFWFMKMSVGKVSGILRIM